MAEELWRNMRHTPEGDAWPVDAVQPPPLSEHSAAVIDREGRRVMVVFGGWSPRESAHSSGLWEYDLRERKWARVEAAPDRVGKPCARAAHCSAAGSWGMLVWGGSDGQSALGDGWLLLPAEGGLRWSSLTLVDDKAPAPAPRWGAAMVAVSNPGEPGLVYMHGGMDGEKRLGDLWQLQQQGEEWLWREVECAGVLRPPPRDAHAIAVDRERRQLYLLGGFTTARCDELYSLALPDPEQPRVEWSREAVKRGGAPRPLCGHSAAVMGGSLVALLGVDVRERSDVAELPLTPAPPAEGASAEQVKQEPEGQPQLKWVRRQFTGENLVRGRRNHSCCQSILADGRPEAKLLVFGGWDGGTYSNSVVELEFERPADAPVEKKKK
eukprot:Hpha_TRINITY_DN16153_c1_g1::TRINITY_DN16153_c1_g1_i1::g.4223::m.4223